MSRRTVFRLAVSGAVFLASCKGATPESRPTPSGAPLTAACNAPYRFVVGEDRSSSYELIGAGLEQTARLVESPSVCPGSEMFFRWIESDSYRTEAALFTARLSMLSPRPVEPSNPILTARWQREVLAPWEFKRRSMAGERRGIANRLRGLHPETSEYTDVRGFIQKAQEILQNTPPGALPVLILVSDLRDTVGRRGPLDLTGIGVLVLALDGEGVDGPAIRSQWHDEFLAAHASAVVIRDISEPPAGALEQLRLQQSGSTALNQGGEK